jgi:hypothetical protein
MSVISTMAKQQLSELDPAIVQVTGLRMIFALQSCEYLKVPQAKQGQTKILKMRNIQFFKDDAILPQSCPDLNFADCISLTFECQKRQDKHNTITQEATGDSVLCPVRFLAGFVRCIKSYPGTSSNTNVSAYTSNGSVEHVTSRQLINALRNSMGAIGKARLRISKEEICIH